ncbi:protein kinase [Rhodoferax koreense]|uniref:Protein kinase n=1 Tax=Rhodoferax koreensis TaxID=1842727 RepID=A0A1P8JX70_9BURK|nr:leucine-rich repeat-containing protein kinase family protein [Rhodoferax koreense]APW38347.1 protein kinase [Rhodoferax koreense]
MHTLSQLRSGALAGLKRLDLSCGLTEFPREIFDLADSLEVLNLSGNRLDTLPDDLPRLHRLRVLFCSDNPFAELPAVLGRCPQLEMVGFKANRIRHVPGAALPPRLRWLILTDNQVETLPAEIGRCTALQKLMLAGNRLQQLPAELAGCRGLELLRISANRFEALPAWLPAMPRLAWLACAGNPMERAVDAAAPQDVDWRELVVEQLLGEGASGLIYRAVWRRPGATPVPVAVKLFKGEVTSDGWPQSEMAASLAAGAHPNLIPVAGRLVGHPEGGAGLVMHYLPSSFRTLAGPPSLASCTRDVYAAGTRYTAAVAQRIAQGTASALAHLHARGLLHGDFYAHNLQCDAAGQAVLGDMGAASFLPADAALAGALQRLEARAFGCLLEELLQHTDDTLEEATRQGWTRLRDDCLQAAVAARPSFAQIVARLAH